ncbi:TPA: radical SAM protein [Aeromonas salmonicida]|nr:radical SAM protein [Aeromonas salmonicida]HEA3091894.1 radical SAM protein [Aeromonas salmonicida]
MANKDIIWNISLLCPWDCEFCCTDAVHVKKTPSGTLTREKNLSKKELIYDDTDIPWHAELNELNILPNFMDKALYHRQLNGLELTFEKKIKILRNIDDLGTSIDFAGGDPLACAENILIIKEASRIFGKSNISITSTGHSISRYSMDAIANIIGTFEFTFDEPRNSTPKHRPSGYNSANLHAAKKLKRFGVRTKCQIPLHNGNNYKEAIYSIISTLKGANVDEVLLMRTFPVGRGMNNISIHAGFDIKRAIDTFTSISKEINGPQIRLQCALRHLYEVGGDNPCDLVRKSYGINYQGLLLASAWATNIDGSPLSEDFILGNIVSNKLSEIQKMKPHEDTMARLNENWGHCKIFAYINSNKREFNSIFSKSDPLYLRII